MTPAIELKNGWSMGQHLVLTHDLAMTHSLLCYEFCLVYLRLHQGQRSYVSQQVMADMMRA